MRAVTRVANPENEKQLLQVALAGTASQTERIVRAWRKCDQAAERKHARYQQTHRSLQTYTDEDGMVVIRGRLPAEVGAVVLKALQAASDVLYKAQKNVSAETSQEEITPTQRKADALKLVAESALNGGLDPGQAERYQVVVHVEKQVLEDPAQPGQSVLEGGTGVSGAFSPSVARAQRVAERERAGVGSPRALRNATSRRIACDASVIEMVHDEKGNVLDVGRKTRTIPAAIRRALDARDPTCQWPGCDLPFVHGHHLQFWADGGETKLDNLANLCHHHHHLVHDGGYKMERLADGSLRFTHPNGRVLPNVPPQTKLANDPVGDLIEQNRETGLELEGWEGKPKWGYAAMDLEWMYVLRA